VSSAGAAALWEACFTAAPARRRASERRTQGWLAEDERAEFAAQHLATASACADQAHA
jgi:hypothetical protein